MSEVREEKWINVDEAVDYFGIKAATIRDWIKKRRLPCPRNRQGMEV